MAKANDWMLKDDRDLLAARFERRRLASEKARMHGMAFFVLTQGILRVGGITALSILVFDFWLSPSRPQDGRALRLFAILVFTSTLTGALAGVWEWHSNEKRFRRNDPGRVL